jgi:hypothetical protein
MGMVLNLCLIKHARIAAPIKAKLLQRILTQMKGWELKVGCYRIVTRLIIDSVPAVTFKK